MPNLACRTCGRVVYATAPAEAHFAEELRCPRCGANMAAERRAGARRARQRRASSDAPGSPDGVERRVAERRREARRQDDHGPIGSG